MRQIDAACLKASTFVGSRRQESLGKKSMSAELFLDTNVLLYACSGARDDAGKRKIAERLIVESNFAVLLISPC
jgi:hypothetical protein